MGEIFPKIFSGNFFVHTLFGGLSPLLTKKPPIREGGYGEGTPHLHQGRGYGDPHFIYIPPGITKKKSCLIDKILYNQII